jgi:hypothetical protein
VDAPGVLRSALDHKGERAVRLSLVIILAVALLFGLASPALAGQGPEDPGAEVTVDRPYSADGTVEAFVQVLTPGGTYMYHDIPAGGPWQP